MLLKQFKTSFANMMETAIIPNNLSREESQKKWLDLTSFIKYNVPSKLFRFRKCGLNEIVSFDEGSISMCSANMFSDKYDSNVYYDYTVFAKKALDTLDAIVRLVLKLNPQNQLFNTPIANEIRLLYTNKYTIQEISHHIYENYMKDLFSLMLIEIDKQEFLPRENKTTKIACFTEDVKSKFMWDTYGDGYKGFTLEYDFRHFCSKAQIYPIIYSNTMYDGTKAIDNIVALSCMNLMFRADNQEIVSQFITASKKENPIDELHWIKMYLYKDKKTYSHEKEWRLIYKSESRDDFCSIQDDNCLKAIYYGMDMKKDYKEYLHNIAKSKELKEYEVKLDKNSRKYDLKIIPYR